MSWQKVVLITLYAVNVLLVWGQVDKPREPYTGSFAAWNMFWMAGIAALVIYA